MTVGRLLILSGVILFVLLIGSPVSAADHWPIAEGEASPFAGQCMTTERAISIGLLASQCKDRIAVELERARELGDVATNLERQKRAIDADAHKQSVELLRREIDRAEAWYRSPLFIASLTVVLTVAGLLGARALVIEAQP